MHSRAFACGRKEVVESLYRLTNLLGSADPCVCRNDILFRLADVGPTL